MQGLSGFFKSFVNKSAEITPHRNDNLKVLHTEENKFDTSKGSNSVAKCDTMDEDADLVLIRETVYDLIKDIRDPEKPQTLEELNVVSEDNISVQHFDKDTLLVNITFVPTVPHCSLASLIGLCLRQKLTTCLPDKHKLDIFVKEGSHETADDINKQINDKERIAAAMENPNLRDLVNQCVSDEGG